MTSMLIHAKQPMRVSASYPDNGNQISLEIEGMEITIFGLPKEQTDVLLATFADEQTRHTP